ncbi:MAG: M23 family metallopeptidase [Clostridia bacterium]|nr:M23 family metallopeptidase [Clostridia bacterium]MDD4376035.1 M23 family metallopeptidase [Clostridia bacterium]
MKISYVSLRKKLKERAKEKLKNKEEIKNKKNKSNRWRDIYANIKQVPKGSYILLIFMIMLLAITTKLNLSTLNKSKEEDYKIYRAEEIIEEKTTPATTDNIIIYQEASSSIFDINEDIKAVETTSNNTESAKKSTKEKYIYTHQYVRPVKGKTIKEYSMDKVIYSATLDMWRVHDGVDIASDEGTDVVAVEKGIVERVYEDAFYGTSVIIDHQNGIKTVYRNLQKENSLKQDKVIVKGEVIGKVGNTGIGEIKDESHIHFEVIQNGEIVDPRVIGIN